MSRLVQEVLEVWREGERLLGELPPLDPDHETIRLSVAQLRALYGELTAAQGSTERAIDASHATMAAARAQIQAARARTRRTRGGGRAGRSPTIDDAP